MRVLLTIALLLGVTSSAFAQSTHEVRLKIVLTGSGTLPLSQILKIEKPRDSALDGMLKRAAVGLMILAPVCR
jgi:hypothetical protein